MGVGRLDHQVHFWQGAVPAVNKEDDLRAAIDILGAEIDRLRAQNAALLAALKQIVELAHHPDESIARAAIAKAS